MDSIVSYSLLQDLPPFHSWLGIMPCSLIKLSICKDMDTEVVKPDYIFIM